jgi:hypothetical protein
MGCKYHRTNEGFGQKAILKITGEERIPFLCKYHKQVGRYHFCHKEFYQCKPNGCIAKDSEVIREMMDRHSFYLEALQDELMNLQLRGE